MQAQSPPSGFWVIGKTRRERVVAVLATLSFCGGLLWAFINDLRYGSEGDDVKARVYTNGLFPIATVLMILISLAAISVFCVILFSLFRWHSERRTKA